MKLCKKAPDLFQRQTFDEQTRLIRFIESNSVFNGETLKPIYKKPFDDLVEGLKGTTGGAGGRFKRTLLTGIKTDVKVLDVCALAA